MGNPDIKKKKREEEVVRMKIIKACWKKREKDRKEEEGTGAKER